MWSLLQFALRVCWLVLATTILLACSDNTAEQKIDYHRAVDKQATFIGTGLKVENAVPALDWFLPDLNSTAQNNALHYSLPPDSGQAQYLRSFRIDDEVGFVWRWHHKGLEIFLLYHFTGGNGVYVRTLHNTHSISVDEATLVSFFHNRFAAQLQGFEVMKWELYGAEEHPWPKSFYHATDNLFKPLQFELFEGRIVTFDALPILVDSNGYCLEYQYKGQCLKLPLAFNEMLEQKGITETAISNIHTVATLKIRLSSEGSLLEVIGGELSIYSDQDTLQHLAHWPVKAGYLGAGSLPFRPHFTPKGFDFDQAPIGFKILNIIFNFLYWIEDLFSSSPE